MADRPRPEQLVGAPLPDLTLPDPAGEPYRLRQHVGLTPFALFFYIKNGTPGWTLELREFRAHHADFMELGVPFAGVCRDKPASNLEWTRRMHLPFPVLSDAQGEAARALHLLRQFKIGGWTIDMVRRSTLLVDLDGTVAAVWGKVKVRGHALDVLRHARALMGHE